MDQQNPVAKPEPVNNNQQPIAQKAVNPNAQITLSNQQSPVRENQVRENQQKTNPNQEISPKPVKSKSKHGILGIGLSGISLTEKAFLAKHLATIIKSGISLPESLDIVAQQSKGRLKSVLENIINEVKSGKALNVALSKYSKYFDALFINMVKVGEKSGTIDQSLNYLANQLTKDARLIGKVRSASIYPVIVLITAFGIGGGIAYFILPKLTKLFTVFNANLPLATKILLAISTSLEKHGIVWLAIIISLIVLFLISRQITFCKNLWSRFLLIVPIFGKLNKSLNLARFSLTLGTLLKSGVSITEALTITSQALGSAPYRESIEKISIDVNSGKTIVEGMEKADPKNKLFPPTTRAMIKVGEKTGSLDESLLYISQFYEEDVDEMTKNLATTIEPILLIFIGIIVAFVAIAVISPMYQLLGSVKR